MQPLGTTAKGGKVRSSVLPTGSISNPTEQRLTPTSKAGIHADLTLEKICSTVVLGDDCVKDMRAAAPAPQWSMHIVFTKCSLPEILDPLHLDQWAPGWENCR